MSGYKRVNFYELCRLCATNQQKDKTHIFQEEGRKIQLQNKIQSCLSLSVCENDFLPKVVCGKCLRTLEVCYSFRQECVSSESMLSSYFKNFRYTEDFKKSGKVYIKDTTPTTKTPNEPPTFPPPPPLDPKPPDHFYTVQLPTIVAHNDKTTPPKMQYTAYNMAGKATPTVHHAPKPHDAHNMAGGNVVVNSNGEVINIAQLVDFEALLGQASANLHKIKNGAAPSQPPPANRCARRRDDDETGGVIKIDLTNQNEGPVCYENRRKFGYALKVEDVKPNNGVIFNAFSTSEMSQQPQQQQQQQQEGGGYNGAFPTTNSGGGGNVGVGYQGAEPSTVNLNVLNVATGGSGGGGDLGTPFTVGAPPPPPPKASPVNDDVKSHICEICQKGFKRREHLYQHVKLHTGYRPYTCENCNKSFMRKEHLLRHMTSHSGQKNFTCNICDKSFSRNDNLLKHRKTHEKQASYTCDICQKQFVMKHYYLAHKLTHDVDERCGALASVWIKT